jgi:hypothetical protein
MTKKDLQLLSEIYDNTRREQPGDVRLKSSPQVPLDAITLIIDTLVRYFIDDDRIEKAITSQYGSGYAEEFDKIKSHIEGLTNIWENLRYEMDPGPDGSADD